MTGVPGPVTPRTAVRDQGASVCAPQPTDPRPLVARYGHILALAFVVQGGLGAVVKIAGQQTADLTHSGVHLASGLLGLALWHRPRVFVLLFGTAYTLLGATGAVAPAVSRLAPALPLTGVDHAFHLAVGLVTLLVGVAACPRPAAPRRRRRGRGLWLWWAGCNVLGATLVALPDAGPPVMVINDHHGPGVVDVLGVAVVVLGWLALDAAVLRHRHALWQRLGSRGIAAGAAVMVAGGVLLVTSLAAEWPGAAWVPGAALLAGPQLAAAAWVAPVTTIVSPPRPPQARRWRSAAGRRSSPAPPPPARCAGRPAPPAPGGSRPRHRG